MGERRKQIDEFAAAVEGAARRQGVKTREGLVYDPVTDTVSDMSAWELEMEEAQEREHGSAARKD